MPQRNSNIPGSLRLHPGQQNLTPEQEAEARRFAQERIKTQLSTEPVDEQAEQGLLHSANGQCLEYHDGWGFYLRRVGIS